MRIVTANELQEWLSSGEVLEKDSHGPKVLHLEDGSILKIFRSRKPALLTRLNPEAQRFKRNALRLAALGIATPQIRECSWLNRPAGVSACLYRPLEGISLDQLFANDRSRFNDLLPELATFIRTLHRRGIYFRSLHLGNILQTPGKQFGLIDFLDIRFKRAPLRKSLIKRNFAHLHNYLRRKNITDFPLEQLTTLYRETADQIS